jgi:GH15 family glucan-1,4-alpha-glucosidase
MRQGVGDVPLGGSLFPPIADYAFLFDCESCASSPPSGSVEWLCLPRHDSPSVFGAILDCDASSFRLTRSRSASAIAPARFARRCSAMRRRWLNAVMHVIRADQQLATTQPLLEARRREVPAR